MKRFGAAGARLCVTHVRNFWARSLRRSASVTRGGGTRRRCRAGFASRCWRGREPVRRDRAVRPELQLGDDNDWFLRAFDAGAVRELLPEVLVFRRFTRLT